MDFSCRVIWKNNEIGKLRNISMDMWRLEGDWFPNDEAAADFERLLSETTAIERLEDISKIIAVTLIDVQDGMNKNYPVWSSCLAGAKLVRRQVVAESALDKFFRTGNIRMTFAG